MAWTDLKASVAAVIKTNGNQEITGALLQSTLNSIIDQVGANASYKGVAIPSTNPGTPDALVFYIASTQGTYANFGGFVLDGGFAVLSNVSGSWSGTKFLKTEMDAKADHGYGEGETVKTVKDVDDSVVQVQADLDQLAGVSDKIDAGIIEALFPDTSSYELGYIPLRDFSVGQQLLYDVVSPISTNLHTIIDVKKNDKFVITGKGGARPRLYGFVDSDNVILYISSERPSTQNLSITAPEDGKLILNSIGGIIPKVIKLQGNKTDVESDLKSRVDKTEAEVLAISKQNYVESYPFTEGLAIPIPAVGSPVVYTDTVAVAAPAGHLVIDVLAGEKYLLTGRGYNNPRLWALTDINDIVLERAKSGQISIDAIIEVKENGKLIVNTYADFTVEDKSYISFVSKLGTFFNYAREKLAQVVPLPKPYYGSFDIGGVFEANVTYPSMPELANPAMRVDTIISGYDALLTANPEYITKTNLGNTSTGLPVYRYDFNPKSFEYHLPRKRLKYIILTGVHGYEPIPPITVLHMMENICNNWETDKYLEFLRFNVDFIILPMVNPYGATADTRRNGNNVDINRNFPEGWSFNPDVNAETYAGTAPLTELETQYVQQTFLDNPDASAIIDYHNFLMNAGGMPEHFIWSLADNELTGQICDEHSSRMSSLWSRKYPYITPNNTISRVTATGRGQTGRQGRRHGIPVSCVYETANAVSQNPESVRYDTTVMTMAYESFVNFVLQIANALTQRGNDY